jgi:hypothetical protein
MTDDQPGAGPEPSEDLEYDLAHEATGPPTTGNQDPQSLRVVVTATPDYDGDYSYDSAHDIRER